MFALSMFLASNFKFTEDICIFRKNNSLLEILTLLFSSDLNDPNEYYISGDIFKV